MKSGKCPKCGSSSVYVNRNELTLITTNGRRTDHDVYVCTACGYNESYITDPKGLQRVAETWKRVGEG